MNGDIGLVATILDSAGLKSQGKFKGRTWPWVNMTQSHGFAHCCSWHRPLLPSVWEGLGVSSCQVPGKLPHDSGLLSECPILSWLVFAQWLGERHRKKPQPGGPKMFPMVQWEPNGGFQSKGCMLPSSFLSLYPRLALLSILDNGWPIQSLQEVFCKRCFLNEIPELEHILFFFSAWFSMGLMEHWKLLLPGILGLISPINCSDPPPAFLFTIQWPHYSRPGVGKLYSVTSQVVNIFAFVSHVRSLFHILLCVSI